MEIDRDDYRGDEADLANMLIPAIGTLERVFLDKIVETDLIEKGRGVTFFDFIGTGITEENIDQIVNNLRNGMFVAENDKTLKEDA